MFLRHVLGEPVQTEERTLGALVGLRLLVDDPVVPGEAPVGRERAFGAPEDLGLLVDRVQVGVQVAPGPESLLAVAAIKRFLGFDLLGAHRGWEMITKSVEVL